MKVLLIDPPGWQRHGVNLGLAYLSESLDKAGVDTKVIDLNSNRYSINEVKLIITDYEPEIIGVSVKTAIANNVADIIRNLKKSFSGITYVVGGPHISICGEEFLHDNDEIDFGIKYEAENSFVDFCILPKEKRETIPNLIMRRKGKIVCTQQKLNLDLPLSFFPRFYVFRDLNLENFRYPLITSRGCPHGCVYCCVGIISGRKWRPRSPEDVVNELMKAKVDYRVNRFEILDDNFSHDLERAKRICRLLIKHKVNMHWYCHNGIRADKLDQELVRLMKRSGCQSIALGIETGDENVFNNIGKGEKILDILNAVKLIKCNGLRCVGYFIIGLPGDSVENTKKTVRFQRRLKLNDHIYNVLVPYPKTKVAELVSKKGRFLEDIKNTSHFGKGVKVSFETVEFSKKDIELSHFLATEQDWVYGEDDLKKIKDIYKNRYSNLPERIICFTEGDDERILKYLQGEFPESKIVGIKIGNIPIEPNIKKQSVGFNNFDYIFDLINDGFLVKVDMYKQQIVAEKVLGEYKKQVIGECLPSIGNWDNIENKYYVACLQSFTPDIASLDNGVIYRDGLVLPFSVDPRIENIACGKIQAGLAFISKAAYDTKAKYTANYSFVKKELQSMELVVLENTDIRGISRDIKITPLQRLLEDIDITFFPEELKPFAVLVSKSKINSCYCHNSSNKGFRYYIAENMDKPIFLRIVYLMKKGFRLLNNIAKNKIRRCIYILDKLIVVIKLWPQIIFFLLKQKFKDCFSITK